MLESTVNNSTRTNNVPKRRRDSSRLEIDVFRFRDDEFDNMRGMTVPQKAAYVLNYCAIHYPYKMVAYNILLQMVTGQDKQPRLKTKEVLDLQSRMTAATKILHEKYGRGKHYLPGVGVRATVDSADRLKHEVTRKRKAASSSMKSLAQSMTSINIREVPDSPEFRTEKAWFTQNSKHVLQEANDLIRRLLPEGDKKEENKP